MRKGNWHKVFSTRCFTFYSRQRRKTIETESLVEVYWKYFLIREHGEESLREFINETSSFHWTIKFTVDWSKEKDSYLDVEVTLERRVQSTYLFFKPTDTHKFLHLTSCNPYQCKWGIPYSQTLGLHMIFSWYAMWQAGKLAIWKRLQWKNDQKKDLTGF